MHQLSSRHLCQCIRFGFGLTKGGAARALCSIMISKSCLPQGQAPAHSAASAAQGITALAVAMPPLDAAAGSVTTPVARGATARGAEGQRMLPRLARALCAPRVLPAVPAPSVAACRQASASRPRLGGHSRGHAPLELSLAGRMKRLGSVHNYIVVTKTSSTCYSGISPPPLVEKE